MYCFVLPKKKGQKSRDKIEKIEPEEKIPIRPLQKESQKVSSAACLTVKPLIGHYFSSSEKYSLEPTPVAPLIVRLFVSHPFLSPLIYGVSVE